MHMGSGAKGFVAVAGASGLACTGLERLHPGGGCSIDA